MTVTISRSSSRGAGSLLLSLKIQGRVIGALLMREILTRYGRHNIGFLWLFIEPMIFTVGVASVWIASKAVHGSNISVWSFALTGYSCLLLWRNCGSRAIKALEPNLALMFHKNVRPIDIFLSRIILEIAGASASFFILATILTLLGLAAPPNDLLGLLLSWAMMCWFASGLALLVGALSEISELLDRLWHMIVYLLFPASGALFLLEWLPTSARNFIAWVPMVHGTEMVRYYYLGPIFTPHFDIVYFFSVNVILTFSAFIALKMLVKQLEL
jgi:capsular polysaccharide transport system permease protein